MLTDFDELFDYARTVRDDMSDRLQKEGEGAPHIFVIDFDGSVHFNTLITLEEEDLPSIQGLVDSQNGYAVIVTTEAELGGKRFLQTFIVHPDGTWGWTRHFTKDADGQVRLQGYIEGRDIGFWAKILRKPTEDFWPLEVVHDFIKLAYPGSKQPPQ